MRGPSCVAALDGGITFGKEAARLLDQGGELLVARRVVADHEPARLGLEGCFGGVEGRRMAAVARRALLGGGVGRFVVEQIDPAAEVRRLGRKVRVRQVGVGTRRVGAVGQPVVGQPLAAFEPYVLAPLGRRDLGDRKGVAGDCELVDVQRRLLFAEEEPCAGHAVAQRNAPHLDRAVFEEQAMFRRVGLDPLDLVGQRRVEVAQVGRQDLPEGGGGVDAQRRAPSVEPERREERKEAETVVAVQVRNEYLSDFQRVDAVSDQLLLRTFARIHEVVLLVDVHHLRRGVTVDRRLGRRRPEDGDAETHGLLRKRLIGGCAGSVRSRGRPRSPIPRRRSPADSGDP